MSITLITGVPGSGKTLYAVSKLLQPIVGTQIPVDDDDGRVVMHPRTIFTNVNGLQLDHELIDANGGWAYKDKTWSFDGHSGGLHDWHEWAQPGAYLVFDEFQKAWPPRPNGAPVPPDIQALDTHRHMGVDFVLMTQNCLNVDRHILGLVDRHLHVRRIANAAVAVVYEWDHASRSLLYKNSITKGPWRYDKKAYKLYKSSRVHTKQRRTIPSLVWFILIGVLAMGILGPVAYSRISQRGHVAAAAPGVSVSSALASGAAAAASAAREVVEEVEGAWHLPKPIPLPARPGASGTAAVLAGCASARGICKCYDVQGHHVDQPAEFCSAEIGSVGATSPEMDRAAASLEAPRANITSQSDLRFLEAVHGDKLRRAEWGQAGPPS